VDLLYVMAVRHTISTVAGTGAAGLTASQDALASPLHTPLGLAVDTVDKILYIADADNGRVRRLDVVAGTISTVAGGGVRSSSKDGEIASDTSLLRPTALALDAIREYLYIIDAAQNKLRRLDLSTRLEVGGRISTIAGFGGGVKAQAPFHLLLRAPQDIVLNERDGVLYIADREHSRIRVVDMSGASDLCPNLDASRLECGHEGMSPATCAAVGCCFDAQHPDCLTQFNQDGRTSPGFGPLDVVTKLEGKNMTPPISFVQGRSSRCCYPKLRRIDTLELLDAPQSIVLDLRHDALYVTQPKRHRVVRLILNQGRCAAGTMKC
jgi:hypothetical protein